MKDRQATGTCVRAGEGASRLMSSNERMSRQAELSCMVATARARGGASRSSSAPRHYNYNNEQQQQQRAETLI